MHAIPAAETTPTSILVVDTDADTRSLYRELLQMNGYASREAEDGRDALVSALAARPRLVITELRLAYLDGYSLCEILRQDPKTLDVPIVAITAEVRLTELVRARRAGADVVLTKPAAAPAILDVVHQLMRDGRVERAASSPLPTGAPGKVTRSHRRFATTTPPAFPPALRCPHCGRLLRYTRSHVGGVNSKHAEQWDLYVCAESCDVYEYRQRTRHLRLVS
jgi:CheY-like chemotaxis protein